MNDEEKIEREIQEYSLKYRNSSLAPLLLSPIYTLRPDLSAVRSPDYVWPAPWPNAAAPGVYFLFDAEVKLLYIGKSALLGKRLSDYFGYEAGRGSRCKLVSDQWTAPPAYLATVAVQFTFEAPSLEEYLISRLSPPNNKLWTAKEPDSA